MLHSQVRLWLDNPVTIRLIQLLKEHREAHLTRMLNIGTIDQSTLGDLAQLKGQINTLDYILDIETFFDGEFKNENVQTFEREDNS